MTRNMTRQPKNGLNTGAGKGNRTRIACFFNFGLFMRFLNKWLICAVCSTWNSVCFCPNLDKYDMKKTNFSMEHDTKHDTKFAKNYSIKESNLLFTASVASFAFSGMQWVYILWSVSNESHPPRCIT